MLLNNYKSIKECSVYLGPLMFLVGPNGAGKSNLLDALRLVAESLNTSLEHALRERGGINEVRRRSSGHPTHFGVRLEWQLPDGTQGVYAFRVGAQKRGGFTIQQEECRIFDNGLLERDGSNLASVLSVMQKGNRESFDRVVDFLSKVMPGIQGIDIKHVGRKETIEFRQFVGTNQAPWRFMAENTSDGTLRALGVLTALFQSSSKTAKKVPFVGIEKPEAAVHPSAAGVVRDGLVTAAKITQIAVTTQSPDLLDDKDIPDESILAVVNRNGETQIAPLDEAGRSAIRDRLYTAGELLRLNQIEPDEEAMAKIPPYQLDLFADYKP